jgi:hypothetical protein
MRAVRARRAARSFALTGFLEVLAAWCAGFALDFFTAPKGFAVFFAAVADFLTVCAGFFAS